MTNKEFLSKVSKLQKEYAEIYKNWGLAGIEEDRIQVTAKKFHELEKEEGLLQHISKKRKDGDDYWNHEAMTFDGVKIIAVENVETIGDKR